MNVMTVDGYHATIEFDPDLDMFRGEILGLSGGADFHRKNPKELHEKLAIAAQAQGRSINTVVQQALQDYVAS